MTKKLDDNKQSRRDVLKSMAIAGGATGVIKALPGDWKKPVVSAVALPAHANTSDSGSLTTCSTELSDGYYGGRTYTATISGTNLINFGEGTNSYNYASGSFNAGTWSISASGTAPTANRGCLSGSCSTYTWLLSGEVGGSGAGTFKRYCDGVQVSTADITEISNTVNSVLYITSTNGTYEYCPDRFVYGYACNT